MGVTNIPIDAPLLKSAGSMPFPAAAVRFANGCLLCTGSFVTER